MPRLRIHDLPLGNQPSQFNPFSVLSHQHRRNSNNRHPLTFCTLSKLCRESTFCATGNLTLPNMAPCFMGTSFGIPIVCTCHHFEQSSFYGTSLSQRGEQILISHVNLFRVKYDIPFITHTTYNPPLVVMNHIGQFLILFVFLLTSHDLSISVNFFSRLHLTSLPNPL